ncbi:MAG: NUDIX domain-containing protein [Candidatus Pacebacteria bacterium]|jgi:isopentenyl-diphosphate Delta-isomerase|nr:NUDIX domain-containing protein [Candidatus Paceibacterota bacterium]MBT4652823.1 NUDIX domain-containing protein [Candidatus Paceibacterota bacterium]
MPYDNQSELFYLVDEQDKVLGSVSRKKAHQDRSKIHRSIGIVLTNSLNQVLLQKRSEHKDTYPEFWTLSASGHVTYGQTYKQAAEREVEEELGIKTSLEFVSKKLQTYVDEQEYSAIFSGVIEEKPSKFDRTEVSKVEWVDIDKLLEFIKNHDVSPCCIETLKIIGYLK